mgnify:CR=1 FL=1
MLGLISIFALGIKGKIALYCPWCGSKVEVGGDRVCPICKKILL